MYSENITILPSRNDLKEVYDQLNPDDPNKDKLFLALGMRVVEHSDEIKKLVSMSMKPSQPKETENGDVHDPDQDEE